MIKDIVKDEYILVKKSEKFVFGEDEYIIDDMLDTANHHKDNCCGLAAVQIGYLKRVILVEINGKFRPFINPKIIKYGGETYRACEGCLSIDGVHETRRYRNVLVVYYNKKGKCISENFNGRVAQIIQHECDHLDGVLI